MRVNGESVEYQLSWTDDYHGVDLKAWRDELFDTLMEAYSRLLELHHYGMVTHAIIIMVEAVSKGFALPRQAHNTIINCYTFDADRTPRIELAAHPEQIIWSMAYQHGYPNAREGWWSSRDEIEVALDWLLEHGFAPEKLAEDYYAEVPHKNPPMRRNASGDRERPPVELEPSEGEVARCRIPTTSDWDGASTLEKANYRAIEKIIEEHPELEQYIDYEGSEIYVLLDRGPVPYALSGAVASLHDYPVLDEMLLGEMEYEAERDAWDNYAARDFIIGLTRQIPEIVEEELEEFIEDELSEDEDTVWNLWRLGAESSNQYVEHTGEGVFFPIERVVKDPVLEIVVRAMFEGYPYEIDLTDPWRARDAIEVALDWLLERDLVSPSLATRWRRGK